MKRRYATVDVFADRVFTGNPVAVVLDAIGLSSGQMQAIASEFGYVETTFLLPPRDSGNTARVRIFTPDREVPFAGHPTIGTAYVLAEQALIAGRAAPKQVTFEELAGVVKVDILFDEDVLRGAELMSPEPLSRHAKVSAEQAAACLCLSLKDICTENHVPQVVTVGLPALVVELASREALTRARPNRQAYDNLFPLDGAKSVYAYTMTERLGIREFDVDLEARMFTWRMIEDPATGSATAAVTGLIAELRQESEISLRASQGVHMGRPSLLRGRASKQNDGSMVTFVGGTCKSVFVGSFVLDGDES